MIEFLESLTFELIMVVLMICVNVFVNVSLTDFCIWYDGVIGVATTVLITVATIVLFPFNLMFIT